MSEKSQTINVSISPIIALLAILALLLASNGTNEGETTLTARPGDSSPLVTDLATQNAYYLASQVDPATVRRGAEPTQGSVTAYLRTVEIAARLQAAEALAEPKE